MRQLIGWTEDWEKEKYKDSGAVASKMFINKYKDTTFYLPDTGDTYQEIMMGFNFPGAKVEGGPYMEILINQV